jgi:hypothetical protein
MKPVRRLPEGSGLIVNNGAAGMPNFQGARYGVVTRIAIRPWGGNTLYGACVEGVYVEALPLRYDHARWERHFRANWPPATPAHESYWQRILHGPDFHPAQAVASLENRSGHFHG